MIISQSGIKRELETEKPFLVIISRDEARVLCEQLKHATEDNFCYGCVTIYPFSWCDTPTNSAPKKWTE